MTPIADMVAAMLAASAAADTIVLAVRTAELVRDMSRTMSHSPRSYEAVRKAKWREKSIGKQTMSDSKARQNVRDIVRDMSQNAPLLTSLSSTESQHGIQEVRKEVDAGVVEGRKRGTRITEDWQPSEADREYARNHGFDDWRIDQIRTEFVNFWIGIPGQRGNKLGARGWSGTWRNRIKFIKDGGSYGNVREDRSVGRATERNAETGFRFGPKPVLVPTGGDEGDVRLLPERRSG